MAKLLPGTTHPLTWSLPAEFVSAASPAEALSDTANFNPADDELICQWLESSRDESDQDKDRNSALAHAMEVLAWCHALPRLSESEVWWDLLQRLVSITVDASALTPVEDGILSQLLGGELALTLAYLFPEINVCRKLARQARAVLSVGLVDLLDGQGMPHACELAALRPLLASWTRCRAMGETMKKGCFNAAAEEQYQWLIRQSLRLARADGSQVFLPLDAGENSATADVETQRCRDLLAAAVQFGDADDRAIAAAALPQWFKRPAKSKLSEASYHSEWAQTAVLRPDWSPGGARLTVLYDGRGAVDVELSLRQKRCVFRPLAVGSGRRRRTARTALRLGGNLLGFG